METGKMTVAARGEALDLWSTLPFVESVMSLERQPFPQLFLNLRQMSADARNFFHSFDAIVSWFGHNQERVAENLYSLSQGQLHTFSFFTGQEACHAASFYLRCVNAEVLWCPSLHLSQKTLQWGELFWRQHQWGETSRILTLHPGSGGSRKRWDPEGFQKIALWWQKKQHGKVLILLGPAEEMELGEWRAVGEVVVGLSLAQVSALLGRTELYLGNDSGVSHLAGAVGSRGIVLFGPTQPRQWRPLGGNLRVFQNTAYRMLFPDKKGISLDEISVDEVIAGLSFFAG